jgi:hypothetical protein
MCENHQNGFVFFVRLQTILCWGKWQHDWRRPKVTSTRGASPSQRAGNVLTVVRPGCVHWTSYHESAQIWEEPASPARWCRHREVKVKQPAKVTKSGLNSVTCSMSRCFCPAALWILPLTSTSCVTVTAVTSHREANSPTPNNDNNGFFSPAHKVYIFLLKT